MSMVMPDPRARNPTLNKKTKPVKKTKVAKTTVPGTVSQDEILRIARERAKSTIAAAQAPVISYGNTAGQQQVDTSEGLASILEGVSKRIQEIYGGASDATAKLASGYSDAFRSDLEAADAATQAQIAQQGLPSPGAAPAGAAADVLYGLGGALPAASLLQQGAGYARVAEYLPVAARMQGRAQQAQTQQATMQKLAEIAAKYPDIFQAYMSDERNWKNQQFDNYVNYINSQKAGSSSTPRTYVDSAGTTYVIDPATGQYVPTGAVSKTSPAAANAKTKAQNQAKTKRDDDTVKQIQKADAWLDKALNPKPVKTGTRTVNVGGVSTSTPTYKTPEPKSYKVVFNYIFNQLWLSLKRYGYTKAQIREMTNEILAARGVIEGEASKPTVARPGSGGPANYPGR